MFQCKSLCTADVNLGLREVTGNKFTAYSRYRLYYATSLLNSILV